MRSILTRASLSLALSILTLGCSGEGGAGTSTPAASVTFTQVYDEVITVSCGFGSCHGSGAGGLTLEADNAYGNLVGPESVVQTGVPLVVPGDPDGSYLMAKLRGDGDISGDPMPPPGGLEAERVALVEAWILAGALDN